MRFDHKLLTFQREATTTTTFTSQHFLKMDPTLNKNIQFSDNNESDDDCANMQGGQDLSDWDLIISQDIEPAKKRKNTEDVDILQSEQSEQDLPIDDTQSEGIIELLNPAKKIKISPPCSQDLFMSETLTSQQALSQPGTSGWQPGQSHITGYQCTPDSFMSETISHDTQEDTSQQFMSEALSHPGPSTGEQDSQFMNDDSSQQVHFDSGSERQLPQTPETYNSFLTKSQERKLVNKHYSQMFTERCLKMLEEEKK